MNAFGKAVAFSSYIARRTKTLAATETSKITLFAEAIDKGHPNSKATGRHQWLSLFITKLPAGEYRVHVLDDSDLTVKEITSADGSTSALFKSKTK
jgi:hypothetical protein